MESNEKHKAATDQPNAHEVRCECGSLVAKLLGSAIELKCRRCKRLALIPLAEFNGGSESITVRM
jgi:phage FluMu protein Com